MFKSILLMLGLVFVFGCAEDGDAESDGSGAPEDCRSRGCDDPLVCLSNDSGVFGCRIVEASSGSRFSDEDLAQAAELNAEGPPGSATVSGQMDDVDSAETEATFGEGATPEEAVTTNAGQAASVDGIALVCEDTDPLPDTAIGENGIGPGMRLTGIEVPNSSADADAIGCRTVGTNNGTGLGGVLSLVQSQGDFDGLDGLLSPMGDQAPDLILLGQMVGWNVGQTAAESSGSLHMYTGTMNEPGTFSIDPESLQDGDLSSPIISFEADTSEGCLVAQSSRFDISLPIDAIGELALSLSAARAEGQLTVNADGFGIENGTITGYLTEDAIRGLVGTLLDICNGSNPPSFCSTVQALLMDDIDLGAEVILGFLGNADSTVDAEGNASSGCDEDALPEGSACAVSICLGITASPTKIAGIAQ